MEGGDNKNEQQYPEQPLAEGHGEPLAEAVSGSKADSSTGNSLSLGVSDDVKKLVKDDNTLSDGTKFKILELLGKDVIEATRMMNGDNENMIPAMMQLACVGVDDNEKLFTMEELLELKSKDFMKIMIAFTSINF